MKEVLLSQNPVTGEVEAYDKNGKFLGTVYDTVSENAKNEEEPQEEDKKQK